MKIIEYRIAKYNKDQTLVEVVNNLIQKGWQPWGAAIDRNYQAMVRYEEKPEREIFYPKEKDIPNSFKNTETFENGEWVKN